MTDADNRFEQIANDSDETEAEDRRTNFLVMVLDRSSSMSSLRQQAIEAFNSQLSTIRETTQGQPIDVLVSLVTFSDTVDPPTYWCVPLSEIAELTPETYVPNGMTAMRDGVGSAISRLSRHELIDSPNSSVLVVVISDGKENHSIEFTPQQLADLITEKQNTGRWTFVYEGANQDLTEVAEDTGIYLGNTLGFDASVQGMDTSRLLRREATQRYYTMASTAPVGAAVASADFYSGDQPEETLTDGDSPDTVTGTSTDGTGVE